MARESGKEYNRKVHEWMQVFFTLESGPSFSIQLSQLQKVLNPIYIGALMQPILFYYTILPLKCVNKY